MKRKEPRNILLPVAKYLPLKKLVNLSGENIIFPFYHAVNDDPPPHLRNLYRVKNTREFVHDLDLLLKHFEVLSPSFLQDHYSLKYLKTPCFILSFDDGLREIKDIVAPVLEQKGIPAIFFLNNSFLDNRDMFYRYKISILLDQLPGLPKAKIPELSRILKVPYRNPDVLSGYIKNLSYNETQLIDRIAQLFETDFREYLDKNKPYMSSSDVKELLARGFFIGAHSFEHPVMADLPRAEQLNEIRNSIKDLVERFGIDYEFFAFPFSDDGIDEELFRQLYKNGKGPDASFGTSGLRKANNYRHYQRIPLEKSHQDAEKYIKTEYFYYLLKSIFL